jgi:predicted SAM-dependent methyltransferase
MIRRLAKKVPGARRVHQALLRGHQALQRIRKIASSKTLAVHYVASNNVRKLHIGCGQNVLAGWLNSDYYPADPNVIHLDATMNFPFDGDTFEYVFSEHMIEHISYPQGLAMLKECCRILKRNGRLRISTPDLKFLINLYSDQKSELQKSYIKWASDTFIQNTEYTDTMVINNFVRGWGHLFIYDEKTLRHSLELSGFADIVAYKINESDDTNLVDLENEERMPAGFLQLETFTLEARKP